MIYIYGESQSKYKAKTNYCSWQIYILDMLIVFLIMTIVYATMWTNKFYTTASITCMLFYGELLCYNLQYTNLIYTTNHPKVPVYDLYFTGNTKRMWITGLQPHPTLTPHYLSRKRMTWWRHQMETFSALLAIWAGNPRTKASDAELRCFLWSIKGWVNNRDAGDLRRYRAHCDVTVK